jgi:hypothetical protein
MKTPNGATGPRSFDEDAARVMLYVHVRRCGCWEWSGPVNRHDGRPVTTFPHLGTGRHHAAARVVWVVTRKTWPPPRLRRVCTLRTCVNPDHHRDERAVFAERALSAKRQRAKLREQRDAAAAQYLATGKEVAFRVVRRAE